jgi:hypothetical protein
MDSERGRHGREEEYMNRTVLVKPEGRSHFRRLNRRWVGNITMDHQETKFDIMDWVCFALNRDKW